MAKKKTIGIGKSKHWNEGRRVKNATKRLKNRIRHQSEAARERALDTISISRKREGGGKQHIKVKDKK